MAAHNISLLSPSALRNILLRLPLPTTLHALHAQVFTDLPATIRARTPPHITLPDLQLVLEYKLSAGQRRPFLPAMIRKNDTALVQSVTTRAFAVPNLEAGQWEAIKSALDILCELKGVGPATASLILAIFYPAQIPFFSDEAVLEVLSVPGGKKGIKYTLKTYKELYDALGEIMEGINARKDKSTEEGRQVGRGDVERAVWITAKERDEGGTGRRDEDDATEEVKKATKKKRTIDATAEAKRPTKKKRTK